MKYLGITTLANISTVGSSTYIAALVHHLPWGTFFLRHGPHAGRIADLYYLISHKGQGGGVGGVFR